MPQMRTRPHRWDIVGATYFVTTVTRGRRPIFQDERNIELLRQALHTARRRHGFKMKAYAFMPDHVHLILSLAPGTHIGVIMKAFKQSFTTRYKRAHGISDETNLWQRGFWDHVIRDADDHENHSAYIHFNPVKHRLVRRAADYPYTSLAAYVEKGWYATNWGLEEPRSIRGWDLG